MTEGLAVKVDCKVAALKTTPLRDLERQVTAKRLAWFDAHGPGAGEGARPTPRRAYELLFRDYMDLPLAEVPVVSESDTEIVWLSRNPCPTLEACRRLGRDTRRVCRGVYEKSTQVLVSRLDPELRFMRDYREIRPHAPHCRERILRLDFGRLMDLALDEAGRSKEEGNKGYGAVVALGERVLAHAHDTAATAGDPSRHAEVNALRQAVQTLGDPDLCGAVLIATCEPCPMCAGLAVWANVTTIVYGASIEETAALGRTRIRLGVRELVERSPALVEVIGGVRRDRCLALYAG